LPSDSSFPQHFSAVHLLLRRWVRPHHSGELTYDGPRLSAGRH